MVSCDVVSVSGKIRDPPFDYFKANLIGHDRQYLSTRAPVTCVFIALDKNSRPSNVESMSRSSSFDDCKELSNISAL